MPCCCCFCCRRSEGSPAAQSGAATPQAQSNYPQPAQGDFVIRDFKFKGGEVLPELRLHYATLGTPVRDGQGVVRNVALASASVFLLGLGEGVVEEVPAEVPRTPRRGAG